MGREIKRVPMNFAWPVGKVWGGYKNPFYYQSIQCPACSGSGYTPEANRLADSWYASWSHNLDADDVSALIKADRLRDFTHTWTKESGWKKKDPPHIPTPHEVNEWSRVGMGYDSINRHVCVEAKCDRLGYGVTCGTCSGDGTMWPSEKIRKQCDRWKKTSPPQGEGWQLWETVSEGSPISPVFATPEELARWLADSPDYTWRRNDHGTTYEQWLKFIGKGWAMSMVCDGNAVKTGVQFVADHG